MLKKIKKFYIISIIIFLLNKIIIFPAEQYNANLTIREQLIRDIAIDKATQNALYNKYNLINKILINHKKYLDKVFNFSYLKINKYIFPPIVTIYNSSIYLKKKSVLYFSNKIYKILYPSRIYIIYPKWEDYLIIHFTYNNNINIHIKNLREAKIWNYYIKLGWKTGTNQAINIFTNRLYLLERDIVGMLNFYRLYLENKITYPVFNKKKIGNVGNDKYIQTDNYALYIKKKSNINLDTALWLK